MESDPKADRLSGASYEAAMSELVRRREASLASAPLAQRERSMYLRSTLQWHLYRAAEGVRRQSRMANRGARQLALPAPDPDEGSGTKDRTGQGHVEGSHTGLRSSNFVARHEAKRRPSRGSGSMDREESAAGYATRIFAGAATLPPSERDGYARTTRGRSHDRRMAHTLSLSPPRRSEGFYRNDHDDSTVFSPLAASRPRLTADAEAAAPPARRKPDLGHITLAEPSGERRGKRRSFLRDGSPTRAGLVGRIPSVSGVVAPGGLPHASLREHSWTAERPGTIRKGHDMLHTPLNSERDEYGIGDYTERRGIGRGRYPRERDAYSSKDFVSSTASRDRPFSPARFARDDSLPSRLQNPRERGTGGSRFASRAERRSGLTLGGSTRDFTSSLHNPTYATGELPPRHPQHHQSRRDAAGYSTDFE
eukprot:jgi/Botrbrau1/10628/Bobra.154_1s0017.1